MSKKSAPVRLRCLERQDFFPSYPIEVFLEILISLDKTLALFINNIAGRWWPIDELIKGLANDYFLIIGASLGLLLLWFGPPMPTNAKKTSQRCCRPCLPWVWRPG